MEYQPDPETADYRKYPKGPNFLLIVILSLIVLFFGLIAAYVILRHEGSKLMLHPHTRPGSALILR
jgi:hypothetical protein